MQLPSAITKRLDAAWAVGSGNGGLDTGSKATNTTYHAWLIARSDTGVVDGLFSTSALTPVMPANYDRKRRVGAIITDGSGNIKPFVQHGDWFELTGPRVGALSATNPGISAVTATLAVGSVPDGIDVDAVLAASISYSRSTVATLYVLISSLETQDQVPTASISNIAQSTASGSVANNDGHASEVRIRTNAGRQIRYRLSLSDANVSILAFVTRWKDRRGRDA